MTKLVAVDIGGTNARFCIAEVAGGEIALGQQVTLPTSDYASLTAAWEAFAAQANEPVPSAAAIAIAAPLAGRIVRMTNNNWVIDRETLAAYGPLDIKGQQWVIVASITAAEAFAPVADFTRNLVLSIAALLVVVALLSLLLAQVFTRPVRRLVGAVRQVAGGDLGVEVAANTRDEFGDLASAFNDMSRSLQVKQALIDEQQAENDKILHTLMPESVARRYRDGDETIAEDHQDVSVLFADLVGFDDFAAGLGAEKELALLNDLVRQFDEAAQEKGIEKVRTLREGYLASCGLIVPRVDSARRTVDFALEMIRIVERFNAQHGATLSLRAGIDTGTVTSGLVGRSSIAYDMWGDAVSIANRVQALAGKPGVFISQRVRDKVGELPNMTEVGTIETKSGPQSVWQISQQRG